MAGYRELGGVRTWYDERGEGEPLVLRRPDLARRLVLISGGFHHDAPSWPSSRARPDPPRRAAARG